jgi:DNA-binding MarR family transcriptional regulator
MEKTGFIIRKSDPNDDRLKWLEITPKGRSVLQDIAAENERNVKRYLNRCSAGMKADMLSILNGILNLDDRRG